MKLAIRLVVLAIAIGLCTWLWIYLHPTPQEAIKRQLNALAKSATLEKKEGNIAAALRANEFSEFFGREVALNMEPRAIFPDSVERSEIAKIMLRLRTESRSLDVKIIDPIITVGADGKGAIVELTVNVATEGDRHLLVQEMKFTMKEVEGDWIIVRVETVRTLNHAPNQTLPETKQCDRNVELRFGTSTTPDSNRDAIHADGPNRSSAFQFILVPGTSPAA